MYIRDSICEILKHWSSFHATFLFKAEIILLSTNEGKNCYKHNMDLYVQIQYAIIYYTITVAIADNISLNMLTIIDVCIMHWQ